MNTYGLLTVQGLVRCMRTLKAKLELHTDKSAPLAHQDSLVLL